MSQANVTATKNASDVCRRGQRREVGLIVGRTSANLDSYLRARVFRRDTLADRVGFHFGPPYPCLVLSTTYKTIVFGPRPKATALRTKHLAFFEEGANTQRRYHYAFVGTILYLF
jgi:hypothetical protein